MNIYVFNSNFADRSSVDTTRPLTPRAIWDRSSVNTTQALSIFDAKYSTLNEYWVKYSKLLSLITLIYDTISKSQFK